MVIATALAGWVTITPIVLVQAFLSSMVTVYVPAVRVETVAVVSPPGAQA